VPLDAAPCTFIVQIMPIVEFGWAGLTLFHRLRQMLSGHQLVKRGRKKRVAALHPKAVRGIVMITSVMLFFAILLLVFSTPHQH
jgi:hypothetical protein